MYRVISLKIICEASEGEFLEFYPLSSSKSSLRLIHPGHAIDVELAHEPLVTSCPIIP